MGADRFRQAFFSAEGDSRVPMYEYQCPKCQHAFEQLVPTEQAGRTAACPRCGTRAERRLSVFSAHGPAPKSSDLPTSGGCGRCGDPNGACPWNG